MGVMWPCLVESGGGVGVAAAADILLLFPSDHSPSYSWAITAHKGVVYRSNGEIY